MLGSVERVLAAVESAAPVEAIDAVARELSAAFGATAVRLLVTDLSGRAMVRLGHAESASGGAIPKGPHDRGERHDDGESATVLPFDGGVLEQAVRSQSVLVLQPDADEADDRPGVWVVVAPVTERGESIGLLELSLPAEPRAEVLDEIGRVAHVLAFVIIANRRHTDLFEWGQRSTSFTLSAEIQQRLLPSARTCEASSFTLAGWLEPADDIGGDTFDYNLARDTLHLSMTDAMGHGVEAALTASVCIGGLRGARRRGLSLLEQVAETNTVLHDHAARRPGDDFAAGLVGRIDLGSGRLDIVNAGHVLPFLLRRDTLTTLDLPACTPFGMFADTTYTSTVVTLQPGDRLILVTDGMLERNVASVDLPSAMRETKDLHPREAVRALADRALAAAGHALQDDATLLCLDWHGSHHEDRVVVSGAEPSRASKGPAGRGNLRSTVPTTPAGVKTSAPSARQGRGS
jgi:serine phosphatase RsbU (regulator of sigma subunit)